jgi:hypothetical protein
MVVGFVFAVVSGAQLQIVEVPRSGPGDSNYCQKIEVKPNLVLRQETRIAGRVTDATGAPFQTSQIEIRTYLSPTGQKKLQVTKTDQDGRFRLETVPEGKYRLLASPTRAFQQPDPLVCERSECELNIVLQASPSDTYGYNCPIR